MLYNLELVSVPRGLDGKELGFDLDLDPRPWYVQREYLGLEVCLRFSNVPKLLKYSTEAP